jgi:hypothetical protein
MEKSNNQVSAMPNSRGEFIFMGLILLVFSTCSSGPTTESSSANKLYETDLFKSYWYSGKAEVNTYTLDQSRYGEPREGSAALIFVSEDFSKTKHVKLDNPDAAAEDKVTVLKMNFTKNFVTGIYPYSMMLSVFKSINDRDYPHAMKAAMSSQEWCGQVFSQINLDANQYAFTGHSYFEKEGEESFSMETEWLEDELWSQVRLSPEDLPVGDVMIIPGLFFARLKHSNLKPLRASVTRTDSVDRVRYQIEYVDQARKLIIFYQKQFPYQILGWEENFEERGQSMRTKAVLNRSMLIDYWTKNKNEFLYLRDSLGLSRHNF